VVWGETLWDMFPDGAKLGGAPANVAWHLGQARGWAQLVSRVGDDPRGHEAIEALDEFVDTSLVQLDPERATGEVQVEIDARGDARYHLVPGRAWERIACTDDVATAIAEAGVFIYGTLAQRQPEGLAGWRAAIRACAQSTLRVCDLNLRRADRAAPHILEAIDAADVLKVNDTELQTLSEWYGWRDPIAEIKSRRARVVAVTHGAAGSTLHAEHVIHASGVQATPGGDNVGCGDAYLAILVLGMTSGWDLTMSAQAASRWASAVAACRGATPRFDDDHIARLLGDES